MQSQTLIATYLANDYGLASCGQLLGATSRYHTLLHKALVWKKIKL